MTATTYAKGDTVQLIYCAGAWSHERLVTATIAKVTPKGYRFSDSTLVNRDLHGNGYRPATPQDVANHERQDRRRRLSVTFRDISNLAQTWKPTDDQLARMEELATQIKEIMK